MIKIIIATHGELAVGLKKSVEFIMGNQDNLFAIPAYTPEVPNLVPTIESLVSNYENPVIFLTDVYGGSVNNEIFSMIQHEPNAYLVCGVNLPMIIQMLMDIRQNSDIDKVVDQSIDAGKTGIKKCGIVKLDNSNEFDSF